MEIISINDLTGEKVIAGHPELGLGCHAQGQAMFLAAGVRPYIVAHAFRRLTMAMLVQSDAGVTLVPDAFVSAFIDRIETSHLSSDRHRMRIASATAVTFQAR